MWEGRCEETCTYGEKRFGSRRDLCQFYGELALKLHDLSLCNAISTQYIVGDKADLPFQLWIY